MNPQLPIIFPHLMTVADAVVGAEVMIFRGDHAIPDHLGDADGCFSLAHHSDGSYCPDSCACEGPAVVHVGLDQTLVIGEWTWRTSRTGAVGWHRTGPSDAELALEVRAATAEKALHDEEVVHRSTLGDLRRTREALAVVIGERDEARRQVDAKDAWLRWWRKTGKRLRLGLRVALWAAVAGWGTALVLVWLVIA